MSQWTHVIGCIRVDGIPSLGDKIEDIEKILGPMCLWDSWDESSTLPRGTEGGLQYRLIEYDKGMCWLLIPIWGDLRDFGKSDVPEIIDWWIKTLKEIKVERIRDAILEINVEGDEEPIILTELI